MKGSLGEGVLFRKVYLWQIPEDLAIPENVELEHFLENSEILQRV